MTLNPNPPGPVIGLGVGCDVVSVGPEPRTDTRVRVVIEAGPLASTLVLDVEASEQLVEQLPAAIAGAVAEAKRIRLGLSLPPTSPKGIVRG